MSDVVALARPGCPARSSPSGERGDRAGLRVHRRPGARATRSRALGRPLSARLGPGLLGGVFDGLLRPLAAAADLAGAGRATGRDRRRAGGRGSPTVARRATTVAPGTVLGTVPDAGGLEHRVLVPPGRRRAASSGSPAGRATRRRTPVAAWSAASPSPLATTGRCAARGRCASGSTTPSRCSPASGCSTLLFPVARGQHRRRARRLRHRQDDAAAADRQVVRRRRHRLRRLRRARQRDGRRRSPSCRELDRPAHRRAGWPSAP